MNKQELSQAVKACIILDLEERYRKEELKAQFYVDCDDRVIQLIRLQNSNPTIAKYIEKGMDVLTKEIFSEQLDPLRRALTRDEELIIDAYIKEVSETEEFLRTVAKCKDLIKLEV